MITQNNRQEGQDINMDTNVLTQSLPRRSQKELREIWDAQTKNPSRDEIIDWLLHVYFTEARLTPIEDVRNCWRLDLHEIAFWIQKGSVTLDDWSSLVLVFANDPDRRQQTGLWSIGALKDILWQWHCMRIQGETAGLEEEARENIRIERIEDSQEQHRRLRDLKYKVDRIEELSELKEFYNVHKKTLWDHDFKVKFHQYVLGRSVQIKENVDKEGVN